MAKKYIVGDWVKFLFEESKVIEVYEDGSYSIDSPNVTGCPKEEELSPIPLTPEILEKNGWKKDDRGYNFRDIIFLNKDDFGSWVVGIGEDYILTIASIHQLQHLLFGLGLNSEMEV